MQVRTAEVRTFYYFGGVGDLHPMGLLCPSLFAAQARSRLGSSESSPAFVMDPTCKILEMWYNGLALGG
jgi:hypothetical protein